MMIVVQTPTTLPPLTPFSPPSHSLRHSPTPKQIQQLHAQSIKLNHSLPTNLITSLCSSSPPHPHNVQYALSLLTQTPPSSFLYNTLIRALNTLNQPHAALLLFHRMLRDPFRTFPDNFTYPFVLKSCAHLLAIQEGEQLHSLALKSGFVLDLFVGNSLIYMYSKCGRIESALKVFDGIENRNVVSWNSIVDGFVKAGDIFSARRVFDEMPDRNVVSWNSMIAGFVKEGLFEEAIGLFFEMQGSGVYPDETTLMSIVSVISELGLLCLGRKIHGYVIRNEFSLDGALGAVVIDMYSKCGSICNALHVFNHIEHKNVEHWTSMIVGFAFHGYGEASLRLFSKMLDSGVKPNYVTFIGVLSACSHGGLVEQGIRHFNLMKSYDVEPRIQHYGCLVDLLGRADLIIEAKSVIDNMPIEPSAVIWSTLLAACRNHGDIEIGEIAAQKLLELTPDYGGGYVLLSNLYANLCRWMDFGRTKRKMGAKGVEKVSGLSWIEVDGEIHEFLAEDKFHPKRVEIYRLLDMIQSKLQWQSV